MPRDLFGDVTDPSVRVGNSKWYTVPFSLAAHASALVAVLIVPILAADVVPLPRSIDVFFAPPIIPAPPPPRAVRPVAERLPQTNPSAAPVEAPDRIAPESGLDPSLGSDLGDSMPGVVEGLFTGSDFVAPPPPPPPPPRVPVPVGGQIGAPQKVRDVSPVYPAIAQSARVEGIVIIQATIDETGRVIDAKVLRSVPLLDQAALEAVRQWQYTPTRLNGVPVAVIMTVTVRFQLR